MLSTAGHSPSQPGSPGETCRRACLRHAADDQKQSSGCSVQATQWRHAPHITHNCRRRYMSRTRLAAGRGRCFNDNVLAGRRARRAFDGPLRPHTPWSPLANRTDRPLAPAFRNCVLHDSMYACARDILQGECDSRAAVSVLCEAGAERTRIRVGRACGRRALRNSTLSCRVLRHQFSYLGKAHSRFLRPRGHALLVCCFSSLP